MVTRCRMDAVLKNALCVEFNCHRIPGIINLIPRRHRTDYVGPMPLGGHDVEPVGIQSIDHRCLMAPGTIYEILYGPTLKLMPAIGGRSWHFTGMGPT